MTFDIGLHEVCVRTGVRYVITKFSGMDSLPNFLTRGAPLRARFARAGAPLIIIIITTIAQCKNNTLIFWSFLKVLQSTTLTEFFHVTF